MTCVVFVEKGFDITPLKEYLEKEMLNLSCPSIDIKKKFFFFLSFFYCSTVFISLI